MQVVTLIGLSKRGKQIVKQHGERWEVVKVESQVLFDSGSGPWIFVQPLTEERAPAHDVRSAKLESASRWVHSLFDANFKVAP